MLNDQFEIDLTWEHVKNRWDYLNFFLQYFNFYYYNYYFVYQIIV